jgi:hypothetical protein
MQLEWGGKECRHNFIRETPLGNNCLEDGDDRRTLKWILRSSVMEIKGLVYLPCLKKFIIIILLRQVRLLSRNLTRTEEKYGRPQDIQHPGREVSGRLRIPPA